MSSGPKYRHKVGATFSASVTYRERGERVNLTAGGYEIDSQIRDGAGALIADLVVEIEPQAPEETRGDFTLTCADTSGWPIRRLMWDIRYRQDGVTVYTETFFIDTEIRVTGRSTP